MATKVGKGLAVIQEELHRMRIVTKAQVESLEIQREVRSHRDGLLLLTFFFHLSYLLNPGLDI